MRKKVLKLTPKEKRIYKAIKKHFPATSDATAYEYAIQGGVKFDFKFK